MLTPVTLSGNYLATAGRRFFPIGINWVPARAAMLDVRDARVLAHDQDDKPALTVHECGQGHAVLCAYPVEFMLGGTRDCPG